MRDNLLTLYEAAEHGFSAPLPAFVRAELEAYVDQPIKLRAACNHLLALGLTMSTM